LGNDDGGRRTGFGGLAAREFTDEG
jgi:hypothetical protein